MIYQHRSGDLAEICTSFFDVREELIDYDGHKVLVIEREVVRSYKPGERPKEERCIIVPGFVKVYKKETENSDLRETEVEPVPKSAYAEIERLIRERKPFPFKGPIEF